MSDPHNLLMWGMLSKGQTDMGGYSPVQAGTAPQLSAYNPTLRDRLATWWSGDKPSPERNRLVEGLLGSRGVGTTGFGLLEMFPVVGQIGAAQDAWRGGDDRGLAMAMVPGYKKMLVDPKSLTFRETMQNNLEAVRNYFPKGDGYHPAIVIKNENGSSILDGHNRAVVAAERGDKLPVIEITDAQYQAAKKSGYDDTEISHAVLLLSGNEDAASDLRAKFPGSGMLRNVDDIMEIISGMNP